MKKIKINKLPKGYHRMPDGTIMRDSDHKQFGGNTISEGAGPYNLEAEGGETIVTDKMGDGLPELYNISGKRHSEGGVKMNESAGSFIFSDTPKMKLGKELNKFFGKPDTKSFTPAELSKKYIDMNDDKLTVLNDNADRFERASAEMNMFNKTYKLGGLAMAQEAKKGFPDGIPQIAGLYATLNGIPTGQDTFPGGGMQSAKYGAQVRRFQEGDETDAMPASVDPSDVIEQVDIIANRTPFNPKNRGQVYYIDGQKYYVGQRRGQFNPFAEQTVQFDPADLNAPVYYMPTDEQEFTGPVRVTQEKPGFFGIPKSVRLGEVGDLALSVPGYNYQRALLTQNPVSSEYRVKQYPMVGENPLSVGSRYSVNGTVYNITQPNISGKEDFIGSDYVLTDKGPLSLSFFENAYNRGELGVPSETDRNAFEYRGPNLEAAAVQDSSLVNERAALEAAVGNGAAQPDTTGAAANMAEVLKSLQKEKKEYGGVKKYVDGGPTLAEAKAKGKAITGFNPKFLLYEIDGVIHQYDKATGAFIGSTEIPKPAGAGDNKPKATTQGTGTTTNRGEKRNVAVDPERNSYYNTLGINIDNTGIGETKYVDVQPAEKGKSGYYGDASSNTQGWQDAWSQELTAYPDKDALVASLPNYGKGQKNPEVEKFQRWMHDTYLPREAQNIVKKVKEVRGEDISVDDLLTNLRKDYGFGEGTGKGFDGLWGTYTSSRRPLSFNIEPLPPKEEPPTEKPPVDAPPAGTFEQPKDPYIPPFIQDVMRVSTMPVIKGRNQLIPSWMPRIDVPLMKGPYLDPTNVNANIQASASQAQQMSNQFSGSPSIARATNMRTQAQAANQVAQNVGDIENKNVGLAANYAMQNANSLMRGNAFNADLAAREFGQSATNRDLFNQRAAALDSETTNAWMDLYTNWAGARNISALTDPFIIDTMEGGRYKLRPGSKIDLNQPASSGSQLTYTEFASDPRFAGMDPKTIQEMYKEYVTGKMGQPGTPNMNPRTARAAAAQQAFGNYINPYPLGTGNAAIGGPVRYSMGGKTYKRRGY